MLEDGTLIVDEDVPEGVLAPLADALVAIDRRTTPTRFGGTRTSGRRPRAVDVVEVPEELPGDEVSSPSATRGETLVDEAVRRSIQSLEQFAAEHFEAYVLERAAWTATALGGHGQSALSRYPRAMAATTGLEKALRFGEGRRLKRLRDQAVYIGTLEPEFEQLSDEQLAGKTVEFRERVANGEPLEQILFEAYAAVREAFKRDHGHPPVRRPDDGRDRPPRGRHRRDENR